MSMDIGSPDYEHHEELDETCQSSLDRLTSKDLTLTIEKEVSTDTKEPPSGLQKEPVETAVVEAPKATVTERVRYTKRSSRTKSSIPKTGLYC